jgi:transcriptional regulator with PAS, ATPase and Fis domain
MSTRVSPKARAGSHLAFLILSSEAPRPTKASAQKMNRSSTQIDLDPVTLAPRRRAYLLLVLEADDPLSGGARFALDGQDEVTIGRGGKGRPRECKRLREGGKNVLAIEAGSPFLSREHARFRREGASWSVEETRSENGVLVNWERISETRELQPGDVVCIGRLYFMFHVAEIEHLPDRDAKQAGSEMAGMVSIVPEIESRLADLGHEVSMQRSLTVTIVGENGTGKEVTAKAIHSLSQRTGPYKGVHCGAISKDLIYSELFGHERGAFTGAERFIGALRSADKGTLLLDEIVEAPKEVQIALLRVLEERKVTPVGSVQSYPVDLLLVAAAQQPLAEAVSEGTFRQDLRGRLEDFTLMLWPLRERIGDLGVLVADLLRHAGVTEADKPRFSSGAVMRLFRHDWPMNIRELAKALARAWSHAQDGEMREDRFPPPAQKTKEADSEWVKHQLIGQLRVAKGNIAEVARKMNCNRSVVHFHMKRFGLDPNTFRTEE